MPDVMSALTAGVSGGRGAVLVLIRYVLTFCVSTLDGGVTYSGSLVMGSYESTSVSSRRMSGAGVKECWVTFVELIRWRIGISSSGEYGSSASIEIAEMTLIGA